jgi:hypothetical protein
MKVYLNFSFISLVLCTLFVKSNGQGWGGGGGGGESMPNLGAHFTQPCLVPSNPKVWNITSIASGKWNFLKFYSEAPIPAYMIPTCLSTELSGTAASGGGTANSTLKFRGSIIHNVAQITIKSTGEVRLTVEASIPMSDGPGGQTPMPMPIPIPGQAATVKIVMHIMGERILYFAFSEHNIMFVCLHLADAEGDNLFFYGNIFS